MKKLGIAIAGALATCLIGVVVYFAIPKNETIDLVLSMSDVTIIVGESEKLVYDCSESDALVVMSVEDKKIAEIQHIDDEAYLKGLKIGSTKLVVKAKYKTATQEIKVNVTVVESTNSDDPPVDDEELEPSDPEIDGGEDTVNGENPEDPEGTDTPDGGEAEVATLNFKNLIGCSVSENKINISAAIAVLTLDYSGDIVGKPGLIFDETKLSFVLDENIGDNTYKLQVFESGEFELKIVINNNEYSFIVVKN